MSRRALAILAVVMLAAAVAWWMRGRPEEAETPGELAVSAGRAGEGTAARAERGGDSSLETRMRSFVDRTPGLVRGRVIDATSGDPVAFVDVLFRRAGAEITATSDDAGRYELELAGGAYDVRAIGDGVIGLAGPQLRVAGGDEPQEYDVRVQQLATLRGRVVDDRGRGVADARVAYVPTNDAQKMYARYGIVSDGTPTDGLGEFEAQVIPGGDVILEARAGDRLGRAVVTAVAPGAERTGIVIELDEGALVSGVVLDPDGRAIGGARVHAAVKGGGMEQRHQVETGTDGRFELPRVIAGTAVLEAEAPGFAQSPPQRVTLAPGARVQVELVLRVPGRLAGRVVDANGDPVADVRVRAGRAGTGKRALETHTGRDGAFAFDEVDEAPYWVSGYKPGFAVATRENVRAPIDDLELRLPAHGGLRGRVVDEGGKPVRAFAVRVEQFRPAGVASPRPGGAGKTFDDRAGEFELYPLEPGVYDFAVTVPGAGAARVAAVAIEPGQWAEETVTLRAGGKIRGRVTSAKTGAPVALARVSVALGPSGAAAFTDEQGRFELTEVAPGRRSISVAHASFASLTVGGIEVPAGDAATVAVQLTPKLRAAADAEISGIGIVLDQRNDTLFVRSVLGGGPAARAGLKKDDVVTAIDGTSTRRMSLADAVDHLRGAAGTTVTVQVRRGSSSSELELERARLTAPEPGRGLLASLR